MKGVLFLALMTSAVLLSYFGVAVDGTANYHATAELHRSIARYRRFLDDEETMALMRNLLQVDEKVNDKLDLTGPDPGNHADGLQLGLDVVEEQNSVQENAKEVPRKKKSAKEKHNQQQRVKSEKKEKERKDPTDDENSTDRDTEHHVQEKSDDHSEHELRPDVKGKEAPVEEDLNENQEVENSEEESHVEKEVDDSDHPMDEPRSAELLTENGNELQPEKDPVDKQEAAGDSSAASQADEDSKDQPLDEKESDLTVDREEKVMDSTEPVVEMATEESLNEKQEPDQQQQQEGDVQEHEQQEGEVQEQEQQQGEERNEGDEGNKSESSESEPFVFPEPYLLGPKIDDWDEQRAEWLNQNPGMKSTESNPKVLIVTGSQPGPCRSSEGDYFHVKSLKVKMDYARIHNYEIYYNFAWLDPLFGSYWVKLPIIRKLILSHPEIEWFFWIDSDAVFTDMLFEAPFHTYEGINMVMWGYHEGFYVQKSWVAFNAGVFLIRNCQWSLDLFDKWSPMGPEGPVRDEYGKILTSFLANRVESYPADDQSALAYLLLTDKAVNSKVKLIDLTDYMVSAWWVEVVDSYETSMEKYHPGLGDFRWPWITHFTGCGPCGGDESGQDYQKCMKNIKRALNFADNQVLAYMGFQHDSLSSENVLRVRNESDRPMELIGVNPWAQQIAQLAAATA